MMAPMFRTRAAASALAVGLLAGCAGSSSPGTAWSVTPGESPAADSTAQPQITVTGDRATLSWIERSGRTATLKFAERAGAGWSEPRTVASGDNWFVNWADVPSVVRLADGSLAAHWLQRSGPGTYAYDVRLAFSSDDGRTWSESVTPHHDGTQTEHGFASLFQAPGAGLGLVWLDGRHMGGGGHDGHEAGGMTLRGATFDRSGTQIVEIEIDDRVCECCPTAVTLTADGPIAAYRNRAEGEIRDIYVSRFVNGAWTPGSGGACRQLADPRVPGEWPRALGAGPPGGHRVVHDVGRGGAGVRGVLDRQRRHVRHAHPRG
jgi:hypothetical protein